MMVARGTGFFLSFFLLREIFLESSGGGFSMFGRENTKRIAVMNVCAILAQVLLQRPLHLIPTSVDSEPWLAGFRSTWFILN